MGLDDLLHHSLDKIMSISCSPSVDQADMRFKSHAFMTKELARGKASEGPAQEVESRGPP